MEFRILGPFEVRADGRSLTPARPKQRALLALLLLRANQSVSVDDLTEALWGDSAPETARTALQGHVSALRKLLGSDRIATGASGYVFRLQPGELDSERFESLVNDAQQRVEPAVQARLLVEALQLWRGEALADFRYLDFAGSTAARLQELRLNALEQRIEADLALGRHAELIPELEQLVSTEPLRERPRAQLMLALHRSGRQADALHVYEDGRQAFSAELGLDPSASLQRLHQQILNWDPALDWSKPPPTVRRQARKTVTVLVTELVPAGSVDPEDLERVVATPLKTCRAILERYGARVEGLFANALVAIFGASRTHEDDPERAVKGAIALLEEEPGDPAFAIRTGIESGLALVTTEGERVEVTGAVLAEASRLQAIAPLGGIVVGEQAHRAIGDVIQFDGFGPASYLAIAVRRLPPGLEHGTDEVAMVGRQHELELLHRTFLRVSEAGMSHLVTIAGEPGAGKSRLVRELKVRLKDRVHTWREGRCLAYGAGVTFWALGEIVKAQCGILESDSPDASLDKLGAGTADLFADPADRAWVEPALAALVGVSASSPPSMNEALTAWRRFLEAIAARGPLVLLIEDIHWADPALVDFFEQLTEEISEVPLLLICTTRLEFFDSHPGWAGGRRNTTSISLSPLDEGEAQALFRAILGRNPSGRLIQRAGGNPLFAQELARMVAASPEAESSIPKTVRSVIAARLDTLTPEVRESATHAAVVGEVFWSGAVASLGGVERGQVDVLLRALERAQFVRRSRTTSVRGDVEYAFAHALVKDAAYDAIPMRERANLHQATAAWIERVGGERISDHAEFIAHHYASALDLLRVGGEPPPELVGKTCHFLTLAGDRAMRLDVPAAERFYRRALELSPGQGSLRAGVLLRIAGAVQERGRLHEAQPMYEDAIVEFREAGDWLNAARALMDMSRALWRIGSSARDAPLIDEAIGLLEPHSLGPDLARAWMLKGRELVHLGKAEESLPWTERALDAADRVNRPDLKVWSVLYRGMARVEIGDSRGAVDLRDSLQLGLDLGLGLESAICYANLGDFVSAEEGPQAGLRTYGEGIAFSERRGLVHNVMWIRSNLPFVLFELGEWDSALSEGESVLDWDRNEGTSQLSLFALAVKIQILVYRQRMDEARAVFDELLPLARKIGGVHAIVHAMPSAALYLGAIKDRNGALDLIREVEAATRGIAGWRAHRIADCARISVAAGEVSLVDALLNGAGTSPRRRLGSVLAARAAVAEARGEHTTARDLYRQAVKFWTEFGHRPELALAWQGEARALTALGERDGARASAHAAGEIFRELGARAM